MKCIAAASTSATRAYNLVTSLQQRFVSGLEQLAADLGGKQRFTPVEW